MRIRHKIHRVPPYKFPNGLMSIGAFSEHTVKNLQHMYPDTDMYYRMDTNSFVTRSWIYNKRTKLVSITAEFTYDASRTNESKFNELLQIIRGKIIWENLKI